MLLKRNLINTRLIEILSNKIHKDELLTRAASLAYSTTAAIAPILLLLVSFLNFLDLNMREKLLLQIRNLMGVHASELLRATIQNVNASDELTFTTRLFGLAFLLFTSSLMFTSLQSSLNIIFGSTDEGNRTENHYSYVKKFLMKRVASFLMVFLFVLVSVISLVGSVIISQALPDSQAWLTNIIETLAGFVFFALLFALTFKIIPDKEVIFKNAIYGGLLTAFLFVSGKYLMKLYFVEIALGSAYGAAGSMMALIIWMYYSSIIILLGAEITAGLHLRGINKSSAS